MNNKPLGSEGRDGGRESAGGKKGRRRRERKKETERNRKNKKGKRVQTSVTNTVFFFKNDQTNKQTKQNPDINAFIIPLNMP